MATEDPNHRTRAIRVDAEVVRLVKVCAARCGESMGAWLAGAVRMRVERERGAAGDARRVATVTFRETTTP